MSPIRTLETRFPRLGYISVGHQERSKKTDKVHPVVSDTIVVHSDRPDVVEPFAEHYGGEVVESPTSTEDNTRFFVATTSTKMTVIVPSDDPNLVCSQWMEAWASSGLVRRCDGVDCVLWRKDPDKKKKEIVGELSDAIRPCVCEAEDLDEAHRCKPTVRLNVVPIDVAADIPGIGVFTVRSTGFFTNSELKGDLELIQAMLGKLGRSVPLELSVEQVRSRRGDRPKFRLNLASTPREALALAAAGGSAMALPTESVHPALEAPVGSFVNPDTNQGAQREEPSGAEGALFGEEVLQVGPLLIPRAGGKKGPPHATPAQWTILLRLAGDVGWTEDELVAAFEQYTGFIFQESSITTAQAFTKWARDEHKTKASA